jgi:hypothetical protein
MDILLNVLIASGAVLFGLVVIGTMSVLSLVGFLDALNGICNFPYRK